MSLPSALGETNLAASHRPLPPPHQRFRRAVRQHPVDVEFARAERFDGVFFIDLPTGADKEAIWQQYRTQYAIASSEKQPSDNAWTGAEIKSCCRLAALLDVSLAEAAHHVVPVAVTAAEQVEKLRAWASGRCLSASLTGIYRREGEVTAKTGRRVYRGPSVN